MKTRKFLLTGIVGIALSGVVLTGCHKKSTSPDSDITAAQDDANASYVQNDSKNVSDAAFQSTGHSPFNFSSYYNATLTWAKDTGAGDTLYIVFPNTPTVCGDGRYRKGEIIVYWPKGSAPNVWAAYLDSLNTVTELFRGYAVGDKSSDMTTVAGTRTWTNEGHNMNGYQNWNFSANLSLTNSGGTATWVSNRNNALTTVGGILYYSITGNAYGTTEKGVNYTLTITSPLYVTAYPWWLGGCPWIEAGTISVNRSSSSNTLTINFGNVGSCDATAVATINGNNYTFSMW